MRFDQAGNRRIAGTGDETAISFVKVRDGSANCGWLGMATRTAIGDRGYSQTTFVASDALPEPEEGAD
jgi:hypothetical protein